MIHKLKTIKKYRIPIILILILFVAILLRIICFSGYSGSDDGAYAYYANKIVKGEFIIGKNYGIPAFPVRVGITFPAALLFKLFGTNEITLIAYPFFISISGLFLIYFLGRKLFNTEVGLLSASIYSLLPIDVNSASMLLPDVPAAFWMTLGVLLLICCTENKSNLFNKGKSILISPDRGFVSASDI